MLQATDISVAHDKQRTYKNKENYHAYSSVRRQSDPPRGRPSPTQGPRPHGRRHLRRSTEAAHAAVRLREGFGNTQVPVRRLQPLSFRR